MKKIILIPDSFKGTISSQRICRIMTNAINEIFPQTKIISIPIGDGGEGTVDSFLQALGGVKEKVKVKNAFFEDMECFYGILNNKTFNTEKTAVIELASCAGLPLAEGRLNPSCTTTYGVGSIVCDALKNGCTNIIIGLGGSCTNDGGCGAASALGVKFFDKKGKTFIPTGETLKHIYYIDTSSLNPLLKKANITTICDIDNPLFGKNGAAYVFAPQKGANPLMVQELDEGLRHLDFITKKSSLLNANYKGANTPGAGAAGGMGYGNLIFLNSKLKMGIEVILDTVNFDSTLKNADLVFTGEGRLDRQSLRGKVISGIAKRAKSKQVPVIAVVGDIEEGIDSIYTTGITAIFSINRLAIPFSQAKKTAESDLYFTMTNILRLIKNQEKIF